MTTTVRIKASQIYKDWHVIDAAGRPLGRVATEAAVLLKGKHKPTYEPHLDDGDFVIIVNAGQVKVTGRKTEQKKYHTHSGFPGGLRTRTYAEQFARFPERVLEKAVWGMLPGGSLGEAIFKHLKVYKGPNHPHQSQIAGSDKARAERQTVQAGIATAPAKKPARLRPLSVPTVIEHSPVEAAPLAAAKPARKVAAPKAEAPAAAAPVVEAAAEPKAPARRTRAAAPAAEAVVEAPKPRARTKAALEAPKPRARTKAATEAPKPATRKKAEAKAPAVPTAAKKPVRRRAAKTEE